MTETTAPRKFGETIPNDDPGSICTANGWAAYQEKAAEHGAGDEPAVPNARFWVARLLSDASKEIHIECERWSDARAFARTVAGGQEVEVMFLGDRANYDRWQVKWAGNAMDPANQPHLVARSIINDNPSGKFRPVKDITF